MSKNNLYSSLESILPPQYIKGKDSIYDHLEEAARYIKDLEKNVKELEQKRDMLKKSSLDNQQCEYIGCSSSILDQSISDSYVKIHTSNYSSNEVEIQISARVEEDDDIFPLSRVVKLLLEEGLNVISCVTSKINQRCVYVIHCQVNDEKLLDLSRLQGRLTSEISPHDP